MSETETKTDPLADLGHHIAASLPGKITGASVAFGELTVTAEAGAVLEVLTFLRDDARCRFISFIDLCGVDHPGRAKRFDVVYHLLSPKHNQRVRLKVATDETTPIASAIGVFKGTDWFEREAYDLYGILFAGHPDMRRILTDYGFEGHPLRKDFPTTGFVEVRWDDDEKRVVQEPVRLVQEFRNFDFESPWEGERGLVGDPKREK